MSMIKNKSECPLLCLLLLQNHCVSSHSMMLFFLHIFLKVWLKIVDVWFLWLVLHTHGPWLRVMYLHIERLYCIRVFSWFVNDAAFIYCKYMFQVKSKIAYKLLGLTTGSLESVFCSALYSCKSLKNSREMDSTGFLWILFYSKFTINLNCNVA